MFEPKSERKRVTDEGYKLISVAHALPANAAPSLLIPFFSWQCAAQHVAARTVIGRAWPQEWSGWQRRPTLPREVPKGRAPRAFDLAVRRTADGRALKEVPTRADLIVTSVKHVRRQKLRADALKSTTAGYKNDRRERKRTPVAMVAKLNTARTVTPAVNHEVRSRTDPICLRVHLDLRCNLARRHSLRALHYFISVLASGNSRTRRSSGHSDGSPAFG